MRTKEMEPEEALRAVRAAQIITKQQYKTAVGMWENYDRDPVKDFLVKLGIHTFWAECPCGIIGCGQMVYPEFTLEFDGGAFIVVTGDESLPDIRQLANQYGAGRIVPPTPSVSPFD